MILRGRLMFYNGQKVVCVNAVPLHKSAPDMDGLEEGRVYTIIDVTTWFSEKVVEDNGLPIVRLFEIKRTRDGYDNWRIGFGVWRFRPLVERKTDISVFKSAPIRELVT
jgi:hypothetical protein